MVSKIITKEKTKTKWKTAKKEVADNIIKDLTTVRKTRSRSSEVFKVKPPKSVSISTEKTALAAVSIPDQDNRYKWCMNILSKTSMSILRREFVKNKRYKPQTYTFEACKNNEAKNRYDDVICIDGTRVVLKERPPDKDYIHANWIVMPDKCKYICTQGPLQETVTDFWQMIYTEKSSVIIMLCAFEEGKNEKCAVYLPQTKKECGKFGPYRVYLRQEKESPFAGVKYNVLGVRKEKKSSLEVHHLSFTDWPDHTAPFDPAPIVGMMKYARFLAKENPITVHCSAGIGRSATFIGIDYAMQKIKQDCKLSMVDVMKDLRKQRYQSIQGIIQYIFLHICVLEGFASEGVIARNGKLQQYFADYTRMLSFFNRKINAKMKQEPSVRTSVKQARSNRTSVKQVKSGQATAR